jgi:hypothetical protein
MLQQTMPRAQPRSRRARKTLRVKPRRAFGSFGLEIIDLVGMMVAVAVAGSQFLLLTRSLT